MIKLGDVQVFFTTIPAHKFLHIKNYESSGYWDFWEKQSLIPGQDCDTICDLLDSIPGRLDDLGRPNTKRSSTQCMGYISDPKGRVSSWGYPRVECYGVRLPHDFPREVPEPFLLIDVPAGEYIVFEHGPFDYETENSAVEEKMRRAMAAFDIGPTGYSFDNAPGKVSYFYHDPERCWKYIRPVKKV